jgi:hypothetical protein
MFLDFLTSRSFKIDMKRDIGQQSLFDFQRPLTLLQASRRRPKFNTQLSIKSGLVLSAQLRAACFNQPIWRLVGISCVRPSICCSTLKKFSSAFAVAIFDGGEGVRTPDLRLAKPALCQTELRPHKRFPRRLVAGAGFEPATFGL